MVSMTDLSKVHGTDASRSRLKARKYAEMRLRAYGIIALSLAGLALVALLWSVVGKAAGALTETYITLPVTLSAEEIDASDPGKANYDGITKDVLKEAFPAATGRSERRELYDLLSSGASFELRERVIADPSLIGQTVDQELLASDVADLYVKGSFGTLESTPHNGKISVVGDEEVTVSNTSNDFAGILAEVKLTLLDQADWYRRQAQLQDNGVRALSERAERASDEEQKTSLEADAASRATERDRLIGIAEDLESRAISEGGTEPLGEDTASVLLKVRDGWVKMTEISATGGKGVIVSPLSEAAENVPVNEWKYYINHTPEESRKVTDRQIIWLETLKSEGAVESVFNWRFFTAGDSREPELAGIWGAAVGSFWTMLVTFCLAFPIGVLAAIYLEEFAPRNRATDFIEVNINNLAAVPSIVFGLLGLAVFITFFGVPRSSPLAGGIVLALMTLPTIIIASRAAIRAVPPSIRDAALGLGASKLQTSFHHVLPLAMPGILTGTIIGMAQALGETAPLIMVGMVAFIVDIPTGITEKASVLPVQVYSWSDFPERAFEARTAAAICVLLAFLVIMNALAVFLRKRFERRW
jgi:phosphate transport system permease protein